MCDTQERKITQMFVTKNLGATKVTYRDSEIGGDELAKAFKLTLRVKVQAPLNK